MRRRRTTAADTETASETETNAPETTDETSIPNATPETAPAPAEDATVGDNTETEAPRRRRSTTRSRRKTTEEPAVEESAPAPAAEPAAPTGDAVAEAPAKPKRTRRRTTKAAEPTAEEAPIAAEAATAPSDASAPSGDATEAPAPEPAESAPGTDAPVEIVPAPALVEATTEPEAASEESPAAGEDVPAPVEAAPEASAEATAPLTDEATEETAAEPTPAEPEMDEAAETPPEAEATPATEEIATDADVAAPEAAEVAAEAAPARQRTRGRRRTGAVTAPATPAPEAEIAPPIAPVVEPAAEEAPAEETGPIRRRTRGLRRTRTAAEPTVPSYRALPAETLSRLAEAKVSVRKGVAELLIEGEPHLPFLFFVNTDDPEAREVAAREIRLAYNAGIRFFTVLAHLPWVGRTGERRYEPLDDILQLVADNAPEGFILPRMIFSPPLSWERAHPEEMTLYADGAQGDISLASHDFWEAEADAALRAAVEHVAQGPQAGRVFGFYLEHGEWFHDANRGYDRSAPNQAGFRAWLRTRYENDVIALRAAWHDGKVTFETAEIPEYRPSVNESSTAFLFYQERERRYTDFHDYSSDIVAQVITRLGRAVKEASGGRSAVAVSYGYTLELMRAGSGHLALAKVLDSPYVDILTGPMSYGSRLLGGAAPLPAPIASITLAGKLWISEDDTKTFLAGDETPDTYNPKIESARETNVVHARNFGAAIAQGAGVSWMDLWGTGWLDDPSIWESLGRLRTHADRLATRRRNPRTRAVPGPDVAVIVDERSFFGSRNEQRLLMELIAQQRDALLRSGARIGFYLLSDLTRRNFPDSARLLIFLNAFRLPTDVRAALRERFQADGRTLAWLFGPGCFEASVDAAGASELTDLIGMQLRLQAWGSRTGTVITDGGSPLTRGMRGQRFGAEERTNPSYYVSDPRAQVLGEYAGTGNPSVAVRRHATWQSVFIGETTLPVRLLQNLYRLAGVPAYATEDDITWIGDSLICLHSTSGGLNTIVLPEEAVIYDLLDRETLTSGGRGVRLQLAPGEVRLLFYGTPAEVTRLGGDPQAGLPGLTDDELPAPPEAFVFGAVAAPRPDVSAEDEELLAAALSDESVVIDKDEDEPEQDEDEDEEPAGAAGAADESAGGKKKRRRRRRRGRGGAEGAEGAAEAVIPPLDEQPESVTPPDDTAAPRTLPPLEELLPDSEIIHGDLPIPDELLPLPSELGLSDEEEETEGEEADESEEAGRALLRRRRRRPRRGRGARTEGGNGESAEPTASPAESDASSENGEAG